MKQLLFYINVLFSISIYAQDVKTSYKYDSLLIGKFYNQAELYSKTVGFNFPVYHTYYDSLNSNLYITVREKDGSGKFYKNNGYQYALNISSDSILWVNDVRKFDVLPIQNHLIISSDVSSARFNKTTGQEVTQYGGKMIYADAASNTGFIIQNASDKSAEESSVKLVGLENAQPVSEHKLPVVYDLVEFKKWGDSLLLISASGIHGINVYTGAKWSVSDANGEKVKDNLFNQSLILMPSG